MRIVILRHGEAENFADSDKSRQLTDNGRQQVKDATRCLKSLDFEFEQMWVSPYLRTQQTCDEVISVIGEVPRFAKELLVPENNPGRVIEAIEACDLDSLLIVSHQPLVSALVGSLVEGDPRFGPPMSPASMACIEADVILAGCCTLSWVRHAPNYEASV